MVKLKISNSVLKHIEDAEGIIHLVHLYVSGSKHFKNVLGFFYCQIENR